MNFIKGRIKEFYLLTTEIETIFLNEYMPAAPGEYVKVYLYGLMYAQQQEEMSHEGLAKELRLTAEDVDKAWSYWADMRVVKKIPNKETGILAYDIEFVNLRELMYGNLSKKQDQESSPQEAEPFMRNGELKEMISTIEQISGKILSVKETQEIYSWINDFKASSEIICYAYTYCYQKGKTNFKYISKVIQQWTSQGFQTEEDVRTFLDGLDQRYAVQKRILQALGMNRGATEAEKQLIDTWFDKMHFNLERVLEACGKTVSIANPNLRYVNKVLENWYQEASADGRDVNKKITVTQTVLNKYFEFLRKKAETEAQERKEQIYKKVPRIEEIDREMTELGSKISRNLLSGRDREVLSESRKMMEMLEAERAVLLTEHNFAVDYTDIKYSCERCKDTGMTDEGTRCSCTKKRIEEAEIWQRTN